jgi:hypothetical protein
MKPKGEGVVIPPTPIQEQVLEVKASEVIVPELKIGIVIGPGGARAWAAIGVLRELERNNIPVYAVYGLEWGSFIAALYSKNGKPNDVEWRASKISDGEFRGGIISSDTKTRNMSEMNKILKEIFQSERAENSKIKFSCTSDSYRQNKSSNLYRGEFVEIMNYCLPFPPLLSPFKTWYASNLNVKNSVEILKNLGANYFILIDPSQGGADFTQGIKSEETQMLWYEVQKSIKAQYSHFHQVVDLRTAGAMSSFNSRKFYIQAGEVEGKRLAKALLEQVN